MSAHETASAPTSAKEPGATGIAGSQTKRASVATSSRNAGKDRHKKVRKYLIIFVIVLTALFLWRSMPEMSATQPAQSYDGRQHAPKQLPSWYGVEHEFILSTETWTDSIRVDGDRCIRFWTDNHEANDATVQVRGINHTTWYDWAEFQARRKAGTLPYTNFGWMRFKAIGVPVVMHTKFLLPGQCD